MQDMELVEFSGTIEGISKRKKLMSLKQTAKTI
jgi:hypothetical protein